MSKKIILYSIFTFNIFVSSVFTEVIFDGSMNESTKNLKLQGNINIKQEFGQISGVNLFHSFKTFNVNASETLTFSGNDSINNIISRVTGDSFSTINGSISSSIENVNLYFINPNGFVFGEDASIHIGGSFHFCTADYIESSEKPFYSSLDNNDILFSTPPESFGFLQGDPQKIIISGKYIDYTDENKEINDSIKVKSNESISFIGGKIEMKNATIQAPEGRINITSVGAGNCKVSLTDTGIDIWSMTSDRLTLDMVNLNHSLIDVSGKGSGHIFIRGEQIRIENDSTIKADNNEESLTDGDLIQVFAKSLMISSSNIYSDAKGKGNGGNIKINVDETITLMNETRVYADATSKNDGAGDAGSIYIRANNINILNYTTISSDTHGDGQGGQIEIMAKDYLNIQGNSTLFTVTQGEGLNAGNGGIITLKSPYISVINKSTISCDTMYGYGNGGEINLMGLNDIPSDIIMIHDSRIFSGAAKDGYGDGGVVNIWGEKVSFINGGRIESQSFAVGKGGNVFITASELEFLGKNDQEIVSNVHTSTHAEIDNAGNAGDIVIQSEITTLLDHANLTASTDGPGNAGKISLTSKQLFLDSKASISSTSNSISNGGDAGKINIFSTEILKMNGQSSITTSTEGKGYAGSILLSAPLMILQQDAIVSSSSKSLFGGNAGIITIKNVENLSLNHSLINTSSLGQGHAGHITVDTSSIRLDNFASIMSESKAQMNGGTAGKITIFANDSIEINSSNISTQAVNTTLDIVNMEQDKNNGKIQIFTSEQFLLFNSSISSSVLGGLGNGGDIDIDPIIVLMNHSNIFANAYKGNGGNIHIVANHFIKSSDSFVQASSKYGLDGQIYIEAPDKEVGNDLYPLASNYLDSSKWLSTPCKLRTAHDFSRLIISGRESIPVRLDDLYTSPALTFIKDDGSDKLRKGSIDASFFDDTSISH